MTTKAIKIILDPGHDKAKYNRGAHPDYWEGAQMWRLYEILRPKLEKAGFIVGGTKTKCDQSLSVTKRGRMAKGYDVLISLHSNACDSPSVDRPVGIYFVDDDCGEIDDISKNLAIRLSEAVQEAMDTSKAQWYSRKSSYDRDRDGRKNDDYYGVLYGAHQVGVPAIILENSFHTNRRAAEWLLKDENLSHLADKLTAALMDFYGVKKTKQEAVDVLISIMRLADNGPQIKFLQSTLKGYGYYLGELDGNYDLETEQAVKEFQEANLLEQDGIAGPQTLAKLTSGEVKTKEPMPQPEEVEIPEEEPEVTTEEKEADVMPRFNTIEEMPTWAKDTIVKMCEKGFLNGTGAGLDLSLDMIRIYVTNDRAGLYD